MKRCILYLTIFLLIFLLIGFIPINIAVTKSELSEYESYYLVQWEQITGASWVIIGDQNGMYEHKEYIDIKGELPAMTKLSVSSGGTTYVCVGTKVRDNVFDYGTKVNQYEFSKWSVLSPVKRNTILTFLPKNYICVFDLLDFSI